MIIGCVMFFCQNVYINSIIHQHFLDQATLVLISDTKSAYCAYAYDDASWLGMFSSISLMCAQMIVMVASSCFVGRNPSPGCSKAWAFAFFIASW